MWKEIIYTFGVIYFSEAQTQFCNCGTPMQQLIKEATSPPIIRPQITSIPVDNSVSNSLANALQLLIVSDVIASTINPRATIPACMPTVTTCDQMPPSLIYSSPDLIAPRIEFISPSSPIVEFLRPQISLESLVNNAPVTNLGSNIYSMQEIISAFPNFETTTPCLRDIGQPRVTLSPLAGGLTEFIGPIANLGPSAELKYPPGIQGALTLNIGSSSPNPCGCGNLNVEPIPYAGVNYFY
ncbi:hypothetical protein RR48_10116 [Papilio machaon]|uniref:Uncharacterized protein n=1 Tax=Papilio machaon TaxID=76193 RepID=A0A194R4Z6_PAPMA|nr:hypothetical protein RR48_10116 [Papilio machaon]